MGASSGRRASIDELDQIAGRLARSAVEHGGSWADVASALRIDRAGAQKAYGELRLPALRVGGQNRYRMSEVEAYLRGGGGARRGVAVPIAAAWALIL